MRNYAVLLLVVCFVNCGLGINTEKLSRDDIEILYPEKVKEPNFTFNCNAGVKLDLIRAKDFTPKEKNSRLRKYSGTKFGYIGGSSVNSTLNEQNSLHTTTTMISIPSVITGEFILEPNNIYHATTDVTVQSGGTLRHMPGAVIKWAANTGLNVHPGGNYIARGTPLAMCVNIADIDDPPFGYWKGIQIQGGNAYVSMSEITYTYVSYAQTGIYLLDITLNRACENNFLEYCNNAILTYGPRQTRIANNILYWNGVGIEAYQESVTGSEDPNSVVKIVSNTCYENNYGIDVHGSSSQSLAGVTMIQTNISAASYYYNYLLEAGSHGAYFNLVISDNGRWLTYPGSLNTNGFPETNPVEVFSNPFVAGANHLDLVYLNQFCVFINASSIYVSESPQVGFTTSIVGVPDVNKLDLGFHYPNWEYSSTIRACDFNRDSMVDTKDLARIADYWLFDYNDARRTKLCDYDNSGKVDFGDLVEIAEHWLDPYDFQTFAQFAMEWQKEVDPRFFDSGPDLNKDNIVNFEDFVILASEWRKAGENYPPVTAIFSDGQYGGTTVSVSGYDSSIFRIFLFVDGCYVNEIFINSTLPSSSREIFMPWLEAGNHQAKIVTFDFQGRVICYPTQQITVNQGITKCTVPSFFKWGNPIPFSASSPSSNIKVSAMYNGQEVWSNTYTSGSYIYGEVPSSITQSYDLECLQFNPVQQGMAAMASSSGTTTAPTTSTAGSDSGYTALIVCPYASIYYTSCIKDRILTDLQRRGYNVKVITFNATHSRIKKIRSKNTIRVLSYIGHGAYALRELGGIDRTIVGLDDGLCVSDKVSNYAPGSAPSWLEPFPAATENTVKTWKEINFTSLKFVTFDNCYNGRLRINSSGHLVENTVSWDWRSDLSESLNMSSGDRFLFSWFDLWCSGCTSEFSKFSCNVWRKLGDGETLDAAINYAIMHSQREWLEGEWHEPMYEFRYYGQGLISSFRL